MKRAKLPNRAAAVEALQRSMQEFKCTGPGKWTVNRSGRNYIALTYTCQLAAFPEYTLGSEPWDLWGGQQILVSSHLKSDRTVSCQKSSSYFASAIIFVED
ncbi:MAG: hypothetical protein ABSB60_03495 [Terracidiphilus sp.]|jgi:hypothetical protein